MIIKGIGPFGVAGSKPDSAYLIRKIAPILELVGSTTPFSVLAVSSLPSRGGPSVFDAQLDSNESVDSILIAFSRFVRRKDPVARPRGLEGVQLHHSVTVGTRVRISLMRVSVSVVLVDISATVLIFSCTAGSSLRLELLLIDNGPVYS